MRVSYGFDILDRITNIVWRNSDNAVLTGFAYGYNNAGMITNVTRSGFVPGRNGVDGTQVSEFQYDSLDRLVSEGSAGSARGYSYDLAGNRLSKTTDGMTVNYTLGTGNRLSSWSLDAVNPVGRVDVAGYANEPIGTNLLYGELYVSNAVAATVPDVQGSNFWAQGVQVGAGTQQIVVAAGDAAGNVGRATNTIFVSIVSNASYSYSAAGCVTNIRYIGNEYTNSLGIFWDGQYRLTEVKTNGASAERHGYDVYGRRVWTCDPSASSGQAETNWFIYSGAQIIADVNATGGLIRTYVWGPGIDNLLAMNVHTGVTTPRTYFPIKDHLGTIHAMVDESGLVVESYEFDAWGRVLDVRDSSGSSLITHHSSLGNRYLWQGREYSWNTGFYYFRARWYEPVTGRWLSNDPIGISGGLNQYIFCANNPVDNQDPSGHCNNDSTMFTSGVFMTGMKWAQGKIGILVKGVMYALDTLVGSNVSVEFEYQKPITKPPSPAPFKKIFPPKVNPPQKPDLPQQYKGPAGWYKGLWIFPGADMMIYDALQKISEPTGA